MTKIQNSKRSRFGHLELVLGDYLPCLPQAGIWNLEFEKDLRLTRRSEKGEREKKV
jgi:hypothetical protein